MITQFLTWTNRILLGLTVLFLLLSVGYWWMRPSEISIDSEVPPLGPLPKGAFSNSSIDYSAISGSLLQTEFTPSSQQLPDLKRLLTYYGKNGRPDADAEKALMHFAFAGNKNIYSILPGERYYLTYDKKATPPQYGLSSSNQPTSLWLEVQPQGNQAEIRVGAVDENDNIIQDPESNRVFLLPEKEFPRTGTSWEIGGLRVDSSILARQRSRWYGKDLFLEKYGGEEYAPLAQKQRIDFGEKEGLYSIYLGNGDVAIWNGERWETVPPGPNSQGKPILTLKRADDRLLTLELWDAEGKSKIMLNMIKAPEPSTLGHVEKSFKFIGAHTRSQFILEIGGKRVLVRPQDWLLQTEKGWIKLDSLGEIEDYVNHKLTGILFVFRGVEQREGRPVIVGHLFNPARTEMQVMTIPMQQGKGGGAALETEKGDSAKKAPEQKRNAPQTNEEEESSSEDEEE